MKALRNLFIILLTALTVLSCGGGGGYASGGTSGTGISSGSVTAFGSIWVNGVEFNTTSSTFTVNGQGGTQADLSVGMVVTVQGSITDAVSGISTTVVAEDVLRGPIENINTTDQILTVMGQTVQYNETTVIDNSIPANFAGLNLGIDVLEIHGHVISDGVISATFIELNEVPLPSVYSVKGFISNHQPGANTFQIGTLLTVNYTNALYGNMPDPSTTSWNGLLVEVNGNGLVAGTLAASKVEPEGLSLSQADKAELEGFVTAVTDATHFELDNQAIVLTGTTIYKGGLQADIAVGSKLEVEGSLSAGVLTAKSVSFRDNIRIEADVVKNTTDLTMTGLGITVTVNAQTKYKGGSYAGFGNITTGDHVQIRGRELPGNTVIATEVEYLSTADKKIVLQAPVDSFTSPNVVLLGISVDTSALGFQFQDVSDTLIDSSTFFAGLSTDKVVKAKGDYVSSTLTWKEIELED